MQPSQDRTPKAIAETALTFWDMHAEDTAGEDELNETVARELVAWGLAQPEAARVVKMMSAALADSVEDDEIVRHPHGFQGDPIYAALLAYIQSSMAL